MVFANEVRTGHFLRVGKGLYGSQQTGQKNKGAILSVGMD